MGNKSTISINNVSYTGSSVTIINGKVIVDGKDVTPDQKEITIVVHGNVDSIKADVCSKITVNGVAGTVHTTSGDIKVNGDVLGSASSVSGDIECADIKGSASSVSGNIKTRR